MMRWYVLIFFGIYFISASQAQSENQRLAILNFEILGNPEDQENYDWLSVGFSESLTDAFSRISKFKMIERSQLNKVLKEQNQFSSSKMDSSDIVRVGNILAADKVLLGSCQITTGHFLVNFRIVDVTTGEINKMDRLQVIGPLDSVLYVQHRICLDIAKEYGNLNDIDIPEDKIKKATYASTKNLIAYKYLNKGIMLFENEQFEDAISMYNLAIEVDKKYEKAFFKKGLTNNQIGNYNEAAESFKKSGTYVEIDSVYSLVGEAYYMARDYKNARKFINKAIDNNPNNLRLKILLEKVKQSENIESKINYTESSDSLSYITIFDYQNGVAKVLASNNKYGFIDTSGQVVIPFAFDEIKTFEKDVAPFRIKNKWGVMDRSGNIIVLPKYSKVTSFVGLYSVVQIKDKDGVIDVKGNQVLPCEYDWVRIYNNSLLFVSNYVGLMLRREEGIYDTKGNELIPLIYDNLDHHTYSSHGRMVNGRFVAGQRPSLKYIKAQYKGNWGVINLDNEVIIPFKYETRESIGDFDKGLAKVNVNEKWGIIDTNGIEIIRPKYGKIGTIQNDGKILVKIKDKWGVTDTTGAEIIPISYSNMQSLGNGFFAAKEKSKWGIIDYNNKIVCDFQYEKMGEEVLNYSFFHNMDEKKNLINVPVVKEGKKYIINQNGEVLRSL